jgi:hypothetical protein
MPEESQGLDWPRLGVSLGLAVMPALLGLAFRYLPPFFAASVLLALMGVVRFVLRNYS